jgi:hypothetical protein
MGGPVKNSALLKPQVWVLIHRTNATLPSCTGTLDPSATSSSGSGRRVRAWSHAHGSKQRCQEILDCRTRIFGRVAHPTGAALSHARLRAIKSGVVDTFLSLEVKVQTSLGTPGHRQSRAMRVASRVELAMRFRCACKLLSGLDSARPASLKHATARAAPMPLRQISVYSDISRASSTSISSGRTVDSSWSARVPRVPTERHEGSWCAGRSMSPWCAASSEFCSRRDSSPKLPALAVTHKRMRSPAARISCWTEIPP